MVIMKDLIRKIRSKRSVDAKTGFCGVLQLFGTIYLPECFVTPVHLHKGSGSSVV